MSPGPIANEPPARYHKILSLEVTGGFFHGQRLDFHPQLNCLIGTCGSGKTTALQLVRFALHGLPAEARERSLLAGTLRTGEVRLDIETKDGLRYSIARTLRGKAEITDGAGRPVAYDPTRSLFGVDAFTAGELQQIAANPGQQRELLDRFDAGAIQAAQDEIAEAIHLLERNAQEAAGLRQEVLKLSEGSDELEGLRAQLAKLPEIQGEHREQVEREIRLRGLHERREGALQRLDEALQAERAQVEALLAPLEGVAGQVPPELSQGADGEPIVAALDALQSLRSDLDSGRRRLLDDLDRARDLLSQARARQRERSSAQEQQYQALFARHKAEKGLADERSEVQRKVLALEERARRCQERHAALERCQGERAGLADRLAQARRRRFEIRQAVARRLNERLEGALHVRVIPRSDPGPYRQALLQPLEPRQRSAYGDLIERLVKLAPRDVARLVEEAAHEELCQLLEARGPQRQRVRTLLQLLRAANIQETIETVEQDDLPEIKLEVQEGHEPRLIEQLSQGQRCIALLLLLLLESERPLLIDEPEQSLDSLLVVDTLLERLTRHLARRRQLVFATHNPNLSVLGKGRVIALEGDATNGRVVAVGGIKEAGGHAERILEGGREAFEKRRRHYREAAPGADV